MVYIRGGRMCVGLTVCGGGGGGYVCGSVYWQIVSYCEGHTCLSLNPHMILTSLL